MASCYKCKEYLSLENNENLKSKLSEEANNEVPIPSKDICYDISREADNEKNKIGSTIKKIQFFHRDFPSEIFPWIKRECFSILKSDSKTKLVVLRIVNSYNNSEDKQTILYSHENANDLGSVYAFMVDLATQMKCDVISYDYSGFGKSEGSAAEKNFASDIEEVNNLLTEYLKIQQQNIILMGNSIGCLPAAHLATDEKLLYEFKCLILISPTIAALRLLSNNNSKLANPVTQALLDLTNRSSSNNNLKEKSETKSICNAEANSEAKANNNNIINNNIKNENTSNTNSYLNNYFKKQSNKLINEFNLPIFLINAKEEESLTYSECLDFVKKFKVQNSWFPSNANWINIIQNCRKKFYEKIKEFLKKLIVYDSNDSFCGFSMSEDKTNTNMNLINGYNNNKLLMQFLRNKTRQESDVSKEDSKHNNIEQRYLQEMDEMKNELNKLKSKNTEMFETAKKSKVDFLRNIDFDSQNKFLLTNMISSEDFGKTLEAEAYYLFGERASYINNYSLRDAKDLENRFNRIDETRNKMN